MKAMNENHHFVIVLSGVNTISSELEDCLYESGCDDALIASRNGVVYLEFDRSAFSFVDALSSAIMDVFSSNLNVGISHIEPSDIVSLSETARRVNRTRESIRLLAKGDRGDGTFPQPISGIEDKAQLWSWVEVSKWFDDHGYLDNTDFENALIIRSINDQLGELDQTSESIVFTAAVPIQARDYIRKSINTIPITDKLSHFTSSMSILLKTEYEFYLENRNEYFKKYPGDYLIIHNAELINRFGSSKEAYQYGTRVYSPGTFLIQKCESDHMLYRKACISHIRESETWEDEYVEVD